MQISVAFALTIQHKNYVWSELKWPYKFKNTHYITAQHNTPVFVKDSNILTAPVFTFYNILGTLYIFKNLYILKFD